MLPVCSAAPSCSSPSLISFTVGAKTISSVRKFGGDEKISFGSVGFDFQEASFRLQASRSSLFPIDGSIDQASSPDKSIFSTNDINDIVLGFSNKDDEIRGSFTCLARELDGSCSINNDVAHLASSTVPEANLSVDDLYANSITEYLSDENAVRISETPNVDLQPPSGNDTLNFQDYLRQPLTEPIQSIPGPDSASSSLPSIVVESTPISSGSDEVIKSITSDERENFVNFFSDAQKSLDTSIFKTKGLIEDTYNTFDAFIKNTVKSATGSFDKSIGGVLSSAGNTNKQAKEQLAGFSGEFSQSLNNAGSLAVDTLRHALFSLEDSISKAATFAAYSYESAKTMLPPEVRNSLNISEEKAAIILTPVGTAIQKVYFVIEALERNLGFDPNDPITKFVLFLSGSAALGVSYWFVRYGGYSGDLSPQLTMELLKNERSAVLIDVRPEDEKEKEGVPDLRRGARFKYASVTFPEVSVMSKKQLKNARHLDDALLAVVIRNLQIVNSGSRVIVMDTKGDRSKQIARSLRRLGIKRPYLVEGGFRCWVKDGLRVKELRPETTLTILNEEAEAILEEIKPTPALVFGSGLGLLAAIYALAEWEKTLQLIGFIGIGQSLYRRVASYDSSEDLKADLRLLLAPVRLGAQALSLAAGNPETNKIGLPISPLSTSVQERVIQAAAKHESQPSESNEIPTRQMDSSSPAEGENLDLSEA